MNELRDRIITGDLTHYDISILCALVDEAGEHFMLQDGNRFLIDGEETTGIGAYRVHRLLRLKRLEIGDQEIAWRRSIQRFLRQLQSQPVADHLRCHIQVGEGAAYYDGRWSWRTGIQPLAAATFRDKFAFCDRCSQYSQMINKTANA